MLDIWRRAVVLDTLMMASVISCTLAFSHFHRLDIGVLDP
jgi:hypothetical protein